MGKKDKKKDAGPTASMLAAVSTKMVQTTYEALESGNYKEGIKNAEGFFNQVSSMAGSLGFAPPSRDNPVPQMSMSMGGGGASKSTSSSSSTAQAPSGPADPTMTKLMNDVELLKVLRCHCLLRSGKHAECVEYVSYCVLLYLYQLLYWVRRISL